MATDTRDHHVYYEIQHNPHLTADSGNPHVTTQVSYEQLTRETAANSTENEHPYQELNRDSRNYE